MKKIACLFLIVLSLMKTASGEEVYAFKREADKNRFYSLLSELRCMVCQNQSILDSNAPLAADLRNQIYQKIKEDQSNAAILSYLVDRYGHAILYRPPLTQATLLLWLSPFLCLIGGLTLLFLYIKTKRGSRE